ASVTVLAGTTSAKFTITTTAVAASTPVTISAAYGGVSKSATLTLIPVAVSSRVVLPVSAGGGVSATLNTVTLNAPAPAGDAIVTPHIPYATLFRSASVTVLAGTTSAKFTITTTAVAASTPVTISATYGGVSKSATLTLIPV